MFSYIIGTIEYKGDNLLILDNNNIGYEITISNNTLMSLPNLGESIKIHTYVHFKEDGVSIYGFENLDEKEMFLKLINISGVGPKAAIGILSGLTPSALSIAIMKQDDKSIASIKGIGKKTAERIVLELKDKVNITNEIANVQIEKDIEYSNALNEAIDVLVSLGINKLEASKVAKAHYSENATAEDIVAKSLRGLN